MSGNNSTSSAGRSAASTQYSPALRYRWQQDIADRAAYLRTDCGITESTENGVRVITITNSAPRAIGRAYKDVHHEHRQASANCRHEDENGFEVRRSSIGDKTLLSSICKGCSRVLRNQWKYATDAPTALTARIVPGSEAYMKRR